MKNVQRKVYMPRCYCKFESVSYYNSKTLEQFKSKGLLLFQGSFTLYMQFLIIFNLGQEKRMKETVKVLAWYYSTAL